MKLTKKPVHACRDCGLNLGDHCGVYDCPHDMWRRRKCPGFQNEEMLKDYQDYVARHPEESSRAERREAAKRRASEDHHQGTRHANGSMAR